VEFEVFEEEEVWRGMERYSTGSQRRGIVVSGRGSRGFVNISSATRNLEVKYRDSRRGEDSEGSEGSEARGVQLEGKAKAEAEVPQGCSRGWYSRRWSSRGWGGIRQVSKGKGSSIPDGGLLWWFAEGTRPCKRAILTVALVVRRGCSALRKSD
jgi:hypothetical protein